MSAVVFADVPYTARGHLGLLFHEAAVRVALHVESRARRGGVALERALDDYPFLRAYLAELRDRFGDIEDLRQTHRALLDAVDAWERSGEDRLPLIDLVASGTTDATSRALLVTLGLVEEDDGFAALFAALQAPLTHRRPTIALLRELLPASDDPDGWSACRMLLDAGLAETMNPDAPRSEWVLRIPACVWAAMRGERVTEPVPHTTAREHDALRPLDELVLMPAVRARVAEISALIASSERQCVIVRGMPGTDRIAVVEAVARSVGRGLLEVPVSGSASAVANRGLGPLCALRHAMPLFIPELGPTETFAVPVLTGYRGPTAVLLGRDGGIAGAEHALVVELPPDPVAVRRIHWQRELGPSAGADLPLFAERYALSSGYIAQCARLAKGFAASERRRHVTSRDVRSAALALNRQQLDSLAAHLDGAGGWDQLVVGPAVEMELRDLERRCLHREALPAALGDDFPGGLNRGVRALFEGPSGTGKTLAARVLAAALGMDLYRVDLAAVVNKYIGETEKNLSRVLGRAEDLDVVLLLDEGDALLTRRTDVRSSNDRYANLETNYLLQRLETYAGIVIITTNLSGQIDPAFRRRMDVVAKFHLPDPAQRWQLWQLHLPPDHTVPDDSLEDIAVRYALSGGQVRNAAVHAALLAVARGGRVRESDVIAAVQMEHRKAGASFAPGAAREPDARAAALGGFLSAIS